MIFENIKRLLVEWGEGFLFAGIFQLFCDSETKNFLNNTPAKDIFFPAAIATTFIKLCYSLAGFIGHKNRNATRTKALVYDFFFFAGVSAAVVGMLVAPVMFALIGPILFEVLLGFNALWFGYQFLKHTARFLSAIFSDEPVYDWKDELKAMGNNFLGFVVNAIAVAAVAKLMIFPATAPIVFALSTASAAAFVILVVVDIVKKVTGKSNAKKHDEEVRDMANEIQNKNANALHNEHVNTIESTSRFSSSIGVDHKLIVEALMHSMQPGVGAQKNDTIKYLQSQIEWKIGKLEEYAENNPWRMRLFEGEKIRKKIVTLESKLTDAKSVLHDNYFIPTGNKDNINTGISSIFFLHSNAKTSFFKNVGHVEGLLLAADKFEELSNAQQHNL